MIIVLQVVKFINYLFPNKFRDTAEQLLYRLRELDNDAFVRISHTLGLGPIDYQRRVSGQISVRVKHIHLIQRDLLINPLL